MLQHLCFYLQPGRILIICIAACESIITCLRWAIDVRNEQEALTLYFRFTKDLLPQPGQLTGGRCFVDVFFWERHFVFPWRRSEHCGGVGFDEPAAVGGWPSSCFVVINQCAPPVCLRCVWHTAVTYKQYLILRPTTVLRKRLSFFSPARPRSRTKNSPATGYKLA